VVASSDERVATITWLAGADSLSDGRFPIRVMRLETA
jgi:hypothetical protein